ncbi:MAG: UDP-N-acetylmuramoyl-L-alanine--D-glutamate ligase [Verrucomicrobiota bacterium]
MSPKAHLPETLRAAFVQPVAVLGKGVSGRAAAALIERLGGQAVFYDSKAEDAEPVFDEAAARHRLVVASPGFAPEHPWMQAARTGGGLVLTETDFAALCWPGRVIGVTGTVGKTTTTDFLAHALRHDGQAAVACGNIGLPLSQVAAEGRAEVAVVELSSFQTEALRFLAPEACLWTNFSENHLDRHRTMSAYFLAKWGLIERTGTGEVILGQSVADFARRANKRLPAHALIIDPHTAPEIEPPADSVFALPPARYNFGLVAALWQRLGRNPEALREAARSYQLQPHRLHCVREVGGVRFWNDSKSTSFVSTLAALAALEGQGEIHWIGGGRSKGGDLGSFARRIAGRISAAYLIGSTAEALREELRACECSATLCRDLPSAVREAHSEAAPGSHILLSPGFGSQDQFSGYEARGEVFERTVQALSTDPQTQ